MPPFLQRDWVRVLLVAAFVFTSILLTVPAAYAAATFSGMSPAPNTTVYTVRPTITVKAVDTAAIWLGTSSYLKIDGATVRAKITYSSDSKQATFTYTPTSDLSVGGHTALVSVYSGTRSTYTWSFTVAPKPALSSPVPTAGSTVRSLAPAVSVAVSQAAGAVTATATVDGVPAAAVHDVGTGRVVVTLPGRLANEGQHTVAVTATNPMGSATYSWTFGVQVYDPMPVVSACWMCHPTYPAEHPMDDCGACHGGTETGDGVIGHTVLEILDMPCVDCHGGNGIYVSVAPLHDFAGDAMHTTDRCGPCHSGSLTVEHQHFGLTCMTCHDSTAPDVVAAIAAGDTRCVSCHAADAHGNDHDSSVDPACAACHSVAISQVHLAASSSSSDRLCMSCHPAPRDSVSAWGGTCVEGDCHVEGSPAEQHGGIDLAHKVGAGGASCMSADCHSGTDLSVIHSAATTETPSGTRTGCGVCHDVDSVPTDSECLDCHPERLQPHGYDAAKHMSQQSCVGSCHDRELKPTHDAVDPAVACSGCHAVLVESIAPWDKTCSACHPTATHAAAASAHVGSDALARDYTSNFNVRTAMSWKSYPFGCSPTPASGQTICHDVSSLSALHAKEPDGGCSICHSAGSAPASAKECLTCHGTGWYDPATSGGTISRPGSDYSSTGTITRVGGSGSDNFSTQLTNDGAASYVQFGSTNAEALFGRGFWWLNPNTTSITNVQVLFRAMKLGLSTTTSRITVVIDVGGTTYVSAAAATNPSSAAYTQYTYTFATNPKTGAAWTPTDLNDPSSPNGLRAFGVRQTVSDTANIAVSEVYLKVNTPATNYTAPPRSGGQAHHYGNYLRSPQEPAGEWSSAIYTQYCYDRCHVYPNTYAYYGQVLGNPTYNPWNAYQGTQMWSSLMGDPNGNSPTTRNLTLSSIRLPAGSPVLDFMTNYSLGTGDAGYVEISTDDGASWAILDGTVGGVPMSSLTGVAGAWKPATYDLSVYAGQSVRLRFRYTNTAGATNAGWCIDTLQISESGTVIFSDDAETLKPEWDPGTHWRRIQYALRWLG